MSATKIKKVSLGLRFLWGAISLEILYVLFELAGYIPSPEFSPHEVEFSSSVVTALIVGSVIITLALMSLIAVMIGHRRNWARWLFLALMAFYVIFYAADWEERSKSALGLGIDAIQLICAVIALVLFYSKDANAWFRGRTKNT